MVGCCGGRINRAGFTLFTDPATLLGAEKELPENAGHGGLRVLTDSFYISGGNYYVDGILCRNERIVSFNQQPHLPVNAAVVELSGGSKEPMLPGGPGEQGVQPDRRE